MVKWVINGFVPQGYHDVCHGAEGIRDWKRRTEKGGGDLRRMLSAGCLGSGVHVLHALHWSPS
jgi:hypothetical protein